MINKINSVSHEVKYGNEGLDLVERLLLLFLSINSFCKSSTCISIPESDDDHGEEFVEGYRLGLGDCNYTAISKLDQ